MITAALVVVGSLFICCELLEAFSIDYNNKEPYDSYNNMKSLLQPSSIITRNVSQSYPITILSRLFSSVPKREYAIRDISLHFGNPCYDNSDRNSSGDGMTVLIGRSASGKSTLLRLLSGLEVPHSGEVIINGKKSVCLLDDNDNNPRDCRVIQSRPVILDRKPDCYEASTSVFDSVIQTGIEALPSHSQMTDEINLFVKSLARYFLHRLGMAEDPLVTPSQLPPSKQYLYGIACACMKSTCTNIFSCTHSDEICDQMTYPIILLDEFLDKEPKTISSKVGRGLLNLTESGAIVIVATHRPDHWSHTPGRDITLSSGRVIAEKRRKVK